MRKLLVVVAVLVPVVLVSSASRADINPPMWAHMQNFEQNGQNVEFKLLTRGGAHQWFHTISREGPNGTYDILDHDQVWESTEDLDSVCEYECTDDFSCDDNPETCEDCGGVICEGGMCDVVCLFPLVDECACPGINTFTLAEMGGNGDDYPYGPQVEEIVVADYGDPCLEELDPPCPPATDSDVDADTDGDADSDADSDSDTDSDPDDFQDDQDSAAGGGSDSCSTSSVGRSESTPLVLILAMLGVGLVALKLGRKSR